MYSPLVFIVVRHIESYFSRPLTSCDISLLVQQDPKERHTKGN